MTRSASATAGLTDAEVAQRVAEGKSNDIPERVTRTVGQIVRANVFTRINAILGVLLLIVLATGSLINGMFGLLIIANSVIGMVQEIRAKQTLDKLAIIGQAKPLVRRQSGTRTRSTNEVVLDDIIELGPGDQVVVDGEVVEEENLEIDESLLTGEADPIAKDAGDTVMSGSFVVSGAGAYRATKVGSEAYAAKLAAEASKFTLVKSELRNGINRILQFITYLLVPAGLLTIYTQLFTTHVGWRESVLRMVGALVPMGSRRPGADDLDRLRRRGGQARPASMPGARVARHRGVGAGGRGLRRQDRHTDRKWHAGLRGRRARRGWSTGKCRRCAGRPGRRRRPSQREHAGNRRGLSLAAGLGRGRERAFQVGHQVERRLLSRSR
ncbi:metal cation transporting P-type ATPase ctpE [Mycobacterium tuberculosis T17]|nr:metal cation transporting P-type ATPase ctpE [Mycobacterium tuberculosis T17]